MKKDSSGIMFMKRKSSGAVPFFRDEHWTGSGLWRILLNLDWIRSVNCFINLGSGVKRNFWLHTMCADVQNNILHIKYAKKIDD